MSDQARVKWVCANCGGENVNCSGTLHWDLGRQDWVFDGVPLDDDYCEDCQDEVRLKQVDLEGLTPAQRKDLIEKLVADLVEGADKPSMFLFALLKDGHKGYANYSDEDLLHAHRDAFESEFLPEGDQNGKDS